MRYLRYISYIILATFMMSCSAEAGPGWYNENPPSNAVPRHYVTGRIFDADDKPIEHIKVTIDWGEIYDLTINYTASDGSFSAEIPDDVKADTFEFRIIMEDIDGNENGGTFETLTDKVIYRMGGSDSPTGFLIYRLNRATALANSRQS